jgi:hypothetical protein
MNDSPDSIKVGTICFIVLNGIAYVQHGVSSSAAVFILITSPFKFSKGPPELPSAIAASVTTAFSIDSVSKFSIRELQPQACLLRQLSGDYHKTDLRETDCR